MRLLARRKSSAILAVAYATLFLWLVNRNLTPLGSWRTSSVYGPFPQERIEKIDDGYLIKETPVYFEVNNPRKFDRALMSVKWSGDAPIITGGVVVSQDPWIVDTRTLYHKYLEELSWPRLEGEGPLEGLTLWQRESKYKSIEEFLRTPPPLSDAVAVDVSGPSLIDSKFLFHNSDRTPIGKALSHSYAVSLRGSQQIYLWSYGEDIDVRLLVQDMNRHDGSDEVKVNLCALDYGQCRPSKNEGDGEFLEDDGEEWNSNKPGALREIRVRSKAIKPGLFGLNFTASDDIFIRRIETTQGKMVWKGQLYIGDEVGYSLSGKSRPLTVWSNGQGYAVRTPHPESVQKLTWKKDSMEVVQLDLEEHNHQYALELPRTYAGDIVSINTPKRDLVISSDGFFALSKDTFFLPEPLSYKSNLDLDRLGINYVIARYASSKERKGVRSNSIEVPTFNVTPAKPLQFFVGMPHGAPRKFILSRVYFKLAKPRLTIRRILDKLEQLAKNSEYD